VIYVSNIDGKPSAHDGKGFITLLGPDGRVLERQWIKGLDAPKGLGVYGDRLYVSDINILVEISIPDKKIVARHTAPEAVFLNDVAAGPDGTVYVSDMGASAIYRLKGGALEKWVVSKRLSSPNGLFVEKDILLAGLKDRIVSIDLQSREITDLILNTGSIDGLEADGQGNYLISDWKGHVYRVNPRGEKILLLDTTPINMQAADIDFIPGSSTLLVPTFNNNRVVAYRVKGNDDR
jgi:outer membrane protein assembly factor BamB